jgi:enoyl-CoA hydratase/carnithine racemase
MRDWAGESRVRYTCSNHIAWVELARPPHNFFDLSMLSNLADCFEALELDSDCRVIVLCSKGSSFCAGADFSSRSGEGSANDDQKDHAINPIYQHAIRLFSINKPVVVAIEGPAIGGGLGLALVGDFRVGCNEAKFSANFTRLGFHPGFGLSYTLPRLIGSQNASYLFFSGCRINGEEAFRMGLIDHLVQKDKVRERAAALAKEIAESAPLAVTSVRETLRLDFVEQVTKILIRESSEQYRHWQTKDFKEGIRAAQERRQPIFIGG